MNSRLFSTMKYIVCNEKMLIHWNVLKRIQLSEVRNLYSKWFNSVNDEHELKKFQKCEVKYMYSKKFNTLT